MPLLVKSSITDARVIEALFHTVYELLLFSEYTVFLKNIFIPFRIFTFNNKIYLKYFIINICYRYSLFRFIKNKIKPKICSIYR